MQSQEQMDHTRRAFMEAGFALFSTRGIEAVSMREVADAAGHGSATLFRYFDGKAGLVLAIAEWKWREFLEINAARNDDPAFTGATAADMFAFYLDSFLEAYRNHRALLRFNQLFNVFIRSEKVEAGAVEAYLGALAPVAEFFHAMYERAQADRTLATDVPEQDMLSCSLHLMLAAVTRYAVGLAWRPEGFSEERELQELRDMIFARYTGGRGAAAPEQDAARK